MMSKFVYEMLDSINVTSLINNYQFPFEYFFLSVRVCVSSTNIYNFRWKRKTSTKFSQIKKNNNNNNTNI